MSVPNVAAGPRGGPDFEQLAAKFEERRGRALRASARRTAPAIVGVLVVAMLALIVVSQSGLWPVLIVVPFAAGGAWIWRGGPRRAYLRSVKDEAFGAAISLIGPGWRFAREGQIDLGTLKPFGIVPSYDSAQQQDLMGGPWCGVEVRIVEARMTQSRSSGASIGVDLSGARPRVHTNEDVEVFKGVIVLFRLPKSAGGRIVIRRRYRGAALFSGLERVKLETSLFEKRFNVYADDQVAARVLLTVTVMERLTILSNDLRRLGGGTPAERLEASVVGDQLLVLVPCNTNLFEARGEDEAGHVAQDIERLLIEVRDVLRLAEALGVAG